MDEIGPYHIEARLGQGGMGVVYKCRHKETGQHAAVKLLPQQLALDPAFFQRFKREVLTLQRLDHENIVKVLDRGVHQECPFYAMEYVEGVSLEAVLKEKGRLPPRQAIEVIRACAEALQHSHALGVVHRDIKPANIMLTEDDRIKLMDFGIAKVLDATRMTATQGVLGTVEYMSPEQSQGKHVDARSDLYSLGVVLYQCLTGRLPISGNTPSEVVMKLKTQQVDPPNAWAPDVPKNLSDLNMTLLEKEPEHRLESAQAVLRELERVRKQLEHSAIADTRQHRVIRVEKESVWKNPWLYILLALILAGVLFAFRRSPESEPAPPPPKTDYRPQPNLMLVWARRAAAKEEYPFASDLCRMIQTHFPESEQAAAAGELLLEIEEKKAGGDPESPDPELPEPAPSAP